METDILFGLAKQNIVSRTNATARNPNPNPNPKPKDRDGDVNSKGRGKDIIAVTGDKKGMDGDSSGGSRGVGKGGASSGAAVDGDGRRYPKLIIMSATLQADKFAEFFGCKIMTIPGRVYPVTIGMVLGLTMDSAVLGLVSIMGVRWYGARL
jgi:hypothetical protein